MRWGQLKDALLETAKLTVMIFTIIWGVLIYVRFLGFADLPGAFSDWITSLDQSPMLTLSSSCWPMRSSACSWMPSGCCS